MKALFRYLFILFPALGFSGQLSAQLQHFIDSAENLLPKIKVDTEKINTLNRLADYYKDSVHVRKYIDQSLALSEKTGFKKGKEDAYVVLANFYARKQVDNVKSVRYYTEGLKVSQEIGDKKVMARCYLQLAIIDGKFKNYSKAIDLLHKARILNIEVGYQKGVSLDDQVTAQIYQLSEKWDSAYFYFEKTLKVPNQKRDMVAVTYINLISVFIGMNQLDSATLYIHKCDSVYGLLNNTYGPLWNRMNMGQIYLLRGDTKKAIENLEPAYNFGETNHNADLLLNVLPTLIEAYRKNGDSEKGFKVQTEWIRLNDSLQDVDKANSILGEQIKYEENEQAKINAILKAKEKAESDAKENRQQIIIYSVSAILVLVLGMSFFIFRGYRQKKKANEIISHQKEMVEEKQKEIVDSITYAKRLQQAILPPVAQIKKSFPESFLLYKPKDIVAGDFYWMENVNNSFFIAAADCTGHGVPGAMVSVVCSNALNRTVKEFGITDPGKILDKVRELVIETFEKSESAVKDGMDISLLSINRPTTDNRQLITWSGANNPLWYIKNKSREIIEVKADKQPIGQHENSTLFTSHEVELSKGDLLFLFTDGYADQFGGPKGKKFRYKQLEELLISVVDLPMEVQKNKLEIAFNDWKGNLEQVDDVCMIGIRI